MSKIQYCAVVWLAAFLMLIGLQKAHAADEMKFKFGDLVVITDGFYKGCTGVVVDGNEKNLFQVEHYIVDVECVAKSGFRSKKTLTVYPQYLEAVKKAEAK